MNEDELGANFAELAKSRLQFEIIGFQGHQQQADQQ